MDEEKLNNILSNVNVPEPDENAQKRALNLALGEFERENQKKSKNFQGFAFLGRLMGNSNDNARRNPMETKTRKRLMYGGIMTAAALALFVAPVIMTQTQETVSNVRNEVQLNKVDEQLAGVPAPQAKPKASGNEFSAIEGNVSADVGLPELFSKKENRAASADMMVADSAVSQSRMAPMIAMEAESIIAPMPAPDIIIDNSYKAVGKDKFEDFDVNPFKRRDDQLF